MPTLALATPTFAAQSELSMTSALAAAPGRNGHVRKAVVDDSDGEPGERRADDTDPGKWWYWNEDEGWMTESEGITTGTLWNNGGTWYVWNGSEWVLNSGTDVQDPTNTPVGATPWMLMLLLAAGYGIVKTIRRKQNAI